MSIAGLGYPLGEAILPVSFAVLLSIVQWRTAWWLIAILTLALAVVLGLMVRGQSDTLQAHGAVKQGSASRGIRRAAFREPRFYLVLFPILLVPFVMTGMFLYQIPLAESRGWAPELIAAAFAAFAVVRAVSSIAVGPLIDRFTALRLVPVFLLPLAGGLLLLNVTHASWAAFGYLALGGVTGGVSGSITSAAWAEMFGAAVIGTMRALTAGLGILSTAASPVLIGLLLDRAVNYDTIINHSVMLLLVGSVAGWFALGLRAKTGPAALSPEVVRSDSTAR